MIGNEETRRVPGSLDDRPNGFRPVSTVQILKFLHGEKNFVILHSGKVGERLQPFGSSKFLKTN
jgi:hypothetical protein